MGGIKTSKEISIRKEGIFMKQKVTILMKTIGLIGLVFSLLFFVGGKPSLRAEEPIKLLTLYRVRQKKLDSVCASHL